MGNNQSNTRTTKYKVFRIRSVEEKDGYIRCHLDDYVSYNNGDEKYIDFECSTGRAVFETFFMPPPTPADLDTGSRPERSPLSVGDYIRIDLNETCEQSSSHSFNRYFDVKTVGREVVDSDGNVSIFRLVADVTNDILQARQRYAEQAQYNRWLAQTES
jgi:hypothetical protein